jgi:hypothetical protein
MVPKHLKSILFILLLAMGLGMPIASHAEPVEGLGMWVWSYSAFATPQARERLIGFCEKNQIHHLDVHIRMSADKDGTRLRDPEAFRALIRLAGEHHVTTAALRGNPKMFFSWNQKKALNELQALIAFSRTLPEDTLFQGIEYDVEPYLTEEWKAKGKSREIVMEDYLSFLRMAGSVLDEKAPHLRLSVDTPFWWDKDELILNFRGHWKRFSEHVQDLTDFITIMSYRRSVREILNCVERERMYAQKIHKVIFPSLETIKLKKNGNISFYGVPREELWKVVPKLMVTARRDPAIGGFMIHCYRGLSGYLTGKISPPAKANGVAESKALRKASAEKTNLLSKTAPPKGE